MRRFPVVFGLLILATASSASALAPKAGDASAPGGLKRRGMLGAQLGPLSKSAREKLRITGGAGVAVMAVLPNSAAEKGGLKSGDAITAVDGKAVDTPPALVNALQPHRAGDVVKLDVVSADGSKATRDLTLLGPPLETSDRHEVEYGAVATKAGKLRTILTRPKDDRKHPALYLIPGIGTFTLDNGGPPFAPYRQMIADFAARDFVTLRVDKPGCGDSEGGPLRDMDFDTQLDGFRQGLKMLRAHPSVDPERIVIFGHSMGGVWGPLIAAESQVRGIAVYGTVSRTWTEYALENARRQLGLAGESAAAIDEKVRQEAAASYLLYAAGKSPAEIRKEHPELAAAMESWEDDKYYSGLSVEFIRQLAAKNLGQAWASFDGHALAVWGKSDFVSAEFDHQLVARIVNDKTPGNGTFIAIPDSDHGMHRAATQEESYRAGGAGSSVQFNPSFLTTFEQWAEKIVK